MHFWDLRDSSSGGFTRGITSKRNPFAKCSALYLLIFPCGLPFTQNTYLQPNPCICAGRATSTVVNKCIVLTLHRCQPLRVSQVSNYGRFQTCKGRIYMKIIEIKSDRLTCGYFQNQKRNKNLVLSYDCIRNLT